MIKIHEQHISITFSPEIWQLQARMSTEIFQKIHHNLEFPRYTLELRTKKSKNPIISAAVLEEILAELKWDFSHNDIQEILKFAIVGSVNSITKAMAKAENCEWNMLLEYIHIENFLNSIPFIINVRKPAENSRNNDQSMSRFILTFYIFFAKN